MGKIIITCANCGAKSEKQLCHLKKSKSVYCSFECFKKKRAKTPEQKKAEKSEYDRKRREKIGHIIKQKKKAQYDHDKMFNTEQLRAKQKENRRKTKESGYRQAYISSEKYKKYKHEYDVKRQAKKRVPEEFVGALFVLRELESALKNSNIREENKKVNKAQKRKRLKLK